MADKFTEEEDEELGEVDNDAEALNGITPKASKAWRSIERHRELRELRKNLDDLFDDPLIDEDELKL